MKIRLTANAGVLLEIDGVRILLDGVCEQTENYIGTPSEIRNELIRFLPDAVCLTHKHRDHYDSSYTEVYKSKTLRPIIGPECSYLSVGKVNVIAVDTRHIGKTDIQHKSFIISGNKTVFFMGDASPVELKRLMAIAKPDVLIAPFAYCNTESSLKMTKAAGAKNIFLAHMPDRENDTYNIWNSVLNIVKCNKSIKILRISESVALQ